MKISASEMSLLRAFVQDVDIRAQKKMEQTGKLEGAHYAAMQEVLKEYAKHRSLTE